jgi:general secretion pathway protein G
MRRGIRGRGPSPGFTLVELLVVMAILGILVAIAVPQLQQAPIRAKEATLREDLFTFRSCLDQYYADKGHYPDSLQTLVTDKYIRKIPVDPFTKSADTWQVVMEEPDSSETASAASAEPPGIVDVKSGSKEISKIDKTPYNTW